MNIFGNNTQQLNEVIFADRNKSYGAYDIRSSYNNSIKKSLLYLSTIVGLLFGSIIVSNKLNTVSTIDPIIVLDNPPIETMEYTTTVDVTPIEKPQVTTIQAAVAPKGGMATTIVDVLTETKSIVDNPVSGSGSEKATGVSLTGTETATNTIANTPNTERLITGSEIFVVVEEMPEFEGGDVGLMKYISKNISYPEIAKEINQVGTVFVSFVVNETGNVEQVKVVKGIGYGCDEEVVRVISKMPRWKKPGKNSGHPVKVRYNIPVAFRLK